MLNRSVFVYVLLGAAWAIIAGWQAVEHLRVREAARSVLFNRARDITSTASLVIRSQRWRGVIFQQRLESALNELASLEALRSIACLNAHGEVVASAGVPIDENVYATVPQGERWDSRSLTLVVPVDLGDYGSGEGEGSRPTVVLPPPPDDGSPGRQPRPPRRPPNEEGATNAPNDHADGPPRPSEPRGGRRRDGDGPRFGRPPWMQEEEWKDLLGRMEKRGLHGFVVVLPTDLYRASVTQDLWMRAVIGCFAALAAVGLSWAWRNFHRSSELQMRLIRASELNSHLKEMNLAAAGLAHETRNPLNIIRGLAQMISKEPSASQDLRRKSTEIAEEVDRVSSQLNEFINYSKPHEVRRAAVTLGSVVQDVVRALKTDVEDKSIRLSVLEDEVMIEADERLLRQVVFNLLMNAIQAVENSGEIEIAARKVSSDEALFEVRDNGPGVPPEHRKEVFRPYFTTRPKGTGLGLAVVQQIVLAHGWEIDCLPNGARGAIFRVSRIKRSAKTKTHLTEV